MTKDEFFDNLAQYTELKTRVKELSMVYQLEAKQSLAKFYRLPIDTFYHYSYEDYGKISAPYIKTMDLQCSLFDEFCAYYNLKKEDFGEIGLKYWQLSFIDFYQKQYGIKLDELPDLS